MVKITPWKEFTASGSRYRIRAKYGIDYDFGRRNNQDPYFSVTGEVERKDDQRPGHWREDAGGQLHDQIAKHFHELAPYLKWHLVSLGQPMHYIANAKYWWDIAMGKSAPAPGQEHVPALTAFMSTIIYGGIPGEKVPYTNDWLDIERWLKTRLPKLMGHFVAAMKTLKVLE